jgi:hypothetical protein
LGHTGFVATIIGAGEGDIERGCEVLFDVGEMFDVLLRQREDHIVLVVADIFEGDVALALDGAALAKGQQATEATIGSAGGGVA